MAAHQQTKGSSSGSQARAQHNGLEALESRVLFSAAAPVAALPEPVLANDGATAIEAALVPSDTFQQGDNCEKVDATTSGAGGRAQTIHGLQTSKLPVQATNSSGMNPGASRPPSA